MAGENACAPSHTRHYWQTAPVRILPGFMRAGVRPLVTLPPYCLSYTAVLRTRLPFALVPLVVRVRLLPSFETTMRPVTTTLPSFLLVKANVRLLILLYTPMSAVGSPVTG